MRALGSDHGTTPCTRYDCLQNSLTAIPVISIATTIIAAAIPAVIAIAAAATIIAAFAATTDVVTTLDAAITGSAVVSRGAKSYGHHLSRFGRCYAPGALEIIIVIAISPHVTLLGA